MIREDIVKAYVKMRQSNESIPDEVLDFMQRTAIESLEAGKSPRELEGDLESEKLLSKSRLTDIEELEQENEKLLEALKKSNRVLAKYNSDDSINRHYLNSQVIKSVES